MNPDEIENDESLLRRYAEQDDRNALGALFTRHAGAAYTAAYRICQNGADAEDAVQSAFINVMRNALSFRGGTESGVRAWIVRIVIGTIKNKIRSEVRRRMREVEVVENNDEGMLPEGLSRGGDPNGMASAVDVALSSLPAHYRLPILLHHCEGLSLREVSETLEVSENTLKTQLKRGMASLRRALGASGVCVDSAGILAVLPFLPSVSVPDALLNSISRIASGTGRAAVASPASFSSPLAGIAAALTVGGVLILAGVRVFCWNGASKPAAPVAIPVANEDRLDLAWDFSKPGVPSEFKVIEGIVKHLPSDGADGGCLQAEGNAVELKIDVPIPKLPVRVSWRSRLVIPSAEVRFNHMVRPLWFPADDVVTLNTIAAKPIPVFDIAKKYGPWEDDSCYITSEYIDCWKSGRRHDLTLLNADPTGRVSILFVGDIQLDNLRIRSVSQAELPGASEYVRLAAGIRTDKDGEPVQVRVPDADGRLTNVVAKYYRHADRWGSNKPK